MSRIKFTGSPATTADEVRDLVEDSGGTLDNIDASVTPIEFEATFSDRQTARDFLDGFWSQWFDDADIEAMAGDAFITDQPGFV